ncbi:MAG: tetratricopeptide repeat protein [bacterium]
MSETRKIIKVFIGSPGDLNKERGLFREIIEEVNQIKAHRLGIELEPIGWEDTLPGKGRPQELINQDIEQVDLMVMLLWQRWGSDTGKYSSGFEEEYELGKSLNKKNNGKPEMILYFRSIPDAMYADPGEQLKKVIRFRDKIEREKKFMYKGYEDESQWEKLLRRHLCEWIDKISTGKPLLIIQPDIVYERENRILKNENKQLKREVSRHKKEISKSRSKEVNLAYDLAEEAKKHANSGRITEAESHYAKAITIFPDPQILNQYGIFLSIIGSLTKAEEKFNQLLELSKQINNKSWESIALGNLGLIYYDRGNLRKAEQYHQQALKLDRELGDKQGEADDLGNLGLIYSDRGNLIKAKQYHQQALKLDRKIGYKQGEALDLAGLGLIYYDQSNLKKAEQYHQQALKLHRKLGYKRGKADQLGNLGLIYSDRGNLIKAEQYHQQALKLDRELGYKQGEAADLGNLGNIYFDRGNLKKAQQYFQQALILDREIGYKQGEADDLGNLGLVYRKKKDLKKALVYLKQAVEILNRCGIATNKTIFEKAIKEITKELREK